MSLYNREPCYDVTCFKDEPPSRFNDGVTPHYHNADDPFDAVVGVKCSEE